MLSRILRGQKGAFLVLTAILVPVIFLFTCLAADLGKGWAYQSKLQNAADAAVLAGAYVYKVNQDQGNTRTRIKEYMNSNMGRDGYKIDRIRYRYKEGDPTKGTLISLYASAEVPTNFISIIGQDSMHVSVVSTAKVTPDGKGSSGIFDYAIYGGHKGRPHDMAWDNSYPWDQNALYFNHPYLHIKGKVHADGPIYLTNNVINGRRAFMVDPGNFTTSIANDRDLWSNFSDNYWDLECYAKTGQGWDKNLGSLCSILESELKTLDATFRFHTGGSLMKYTKKERMNIGRQIYEDQINKYEAAGKYGISAQTAREYMRMYRNTNHLPPKTSKPRDYGLAKAKVIPEAAKLDEYQKMSKEDLISALIDARIREERLKLGYEVVEEDDSKKKLITYVKKTAK